MWQVFTASEQLSLLVCLVSPCLASLSAAFFHFFFSTGLLLLYRCLLNVLPPVRRQRRHQPPASPVPPIAPIGCSSTPPRLVPYYFGSSRNLPITPPPPPASPSDGAVFVQTRPAQRLVARAGQCGALGGRVSLYPHLWHGLRLSVVSTPDPPPTPTSPPHPPSQRHHVSTLLSNTSRNIILDCGKWQSSTTMAGYLDAYTNSCSAAANSISSSCMFRASGPPACLLASLLSSSKGEFGRVCCFFCNRLICFHLNHFVAAGNILSLNLRFGHMPVLCLFFHSTNVLNWLRLRITLEEKHLKQECCSLSY